MHRYDGDHSLNSFQADGQGVPPLPEPISPPESRVAYAQPHGEQGGAADLQPAGLPLVRLPLFRSLRHGCYLVRFTPSQPSLFFSHHDGTLRVERQGVNTVASGDLYIHRVLPLVGFPPTPEPNPSAGIPIFRRNLYSYYLRVTQILEFITASNNFTLGFERYRFNTSSGAWTNEGAFTARMTWTTAPAGYPEASQYLTGSVKNASGAVVGTLTMGWISPFLRRAVVEIDRVSASEAPLNNGAGLGWQEALNPAGWQITVIQSQSNLTEPGGESWSDAELHAAMLAHRAVSDLDAEWRYHLLCVRRLDSTSRGIMYDAYGGDSNNVPREGFALASHWVIPNQSSWGSTAGQRFGLARAPYFRTVIHECGHAMGLYHNSVDNGFMNTTPAIVGSATAANPFPGNIQWTFAADDAKRLRHMPDPWVRPGGIPFGTAYGTAPLSPDDGRQVLPGLALRASAVLSAVPIGAPVRVDLSLRNASEQPVQVPESLELKRGFVEGRVIDPSGTVRTFRSLLHCLDEHPLRTLRPGSQVSGSMTLLRGAEGALFPASGTYRIVVAVSWELEGIPVGVTGETQVMVTGAVDSEHATAALKILSTPDTLLTLALGGDHLEEGNAAIQAGLDNPVLHPHFAFIEAKRLGKRFFRRPPRLDAAVRLIEEDTVLSIAELKKAAELVRRAGDQASGRATRDRQAAQVLRRKVSEVDVDGATRSAIEAL
jgi:hypothetical protein